MRASLITIATLVLLLTPAALATSAVRGDLVFGHGGSATGHAVTSADAGLLDLAPSLRLGGTLVAHARAAHGYVVTTSRTRVAQGPASQDVPENDTVSLLSGNVTFSGCRDGCELVVYPEGHGALSVSGASARLPALTALPLVFAVNALQEGTPDNYYYEAPAGSYLVPFGAAAGPGLSSATARATGQIEVMAYGVQVTLRNDTGGEASFDTGRFTTPVLGPAGTQTLAQKETERFLVLDLDGSDVQVPNAAGSLLAPTLRVALDGALAAPSTSGWMEVDGHRYVLDKDALKLEGTLTFDPRRPDPPESLKEAGALNAVAGTFSGQARVASVGGVAIPLRPEPTTPAQAAAGISLLAFAALAIFLARHALAAPFYSRINHATVLANENRQRILALLSARPGLTATEVAREAGLARVVAQHHLRMLVVHKMLVARPHGRSVAFAPPERVNEGAATDAGWLLRDASRARIAQALASAPAPQTQMQLAGLTGLSRRLVAHHLQRMESAGLVRREPGMPQRYVAGPALQTTPAAS
ncbi:MAG: hypothetical protein QOE90_333 [Thermoplasmata archaeon]|jgi:predicted transcriptional regulator|nr:hypothetical protein [Thermoplasmata archaeon]